MKHFERLESGIDVGPMIAEIERQPEAWQKQTGRQDRAPVQRETASIPIRGLRRSRIRMRRRRDVHESRFTSLSHEFPATVNFIRLVAFERDAHLGRAKIVRLNPRAHVHPHIDRGDYYARRDRLHLVLTSPLGSWLRAGGEEVRMREGELWWFDNKQVHEASNEADVARVHLIFDLLPMAPQLARSHRPAPTVLFEDTRSELDRVLADARARAAETIDGAVEQGVRLYLAGRAQPRRWQRMVERYAPGAESLSPFRAVTRLLLGERGAGEERDIALAMAWALARLETGQLGGAGISAGVCHEGGTGDVARAWRREKAGDSGAVTGPAAR